MKNKLLALLFMVPMILVGEINWLSDFDEGVAAAEAQNKPLLVYFSGSDWCSWCQKLDSEVLAQETFQDRVSERFIFVQVDFPRRTPLSEEQQATNDALRRRFAVRGFPTIMLLDSNGRVMETTGYRPGGADSYSEYLLQIAEEHEALNESLANLKQMDTAAVQNLFEHARRLGREDAMEAAFLAGMSREDNVYFLLEEYRRLTDSENLQDEEVTALRTQLLASGNDEAMYQIAVSDFQDLADSGSTEEAIQPLMNYLANSAESTHTWKVNMMVSQAHQSLGNSSEALQHARVAQQQAPESFQAEIAQSISQTEKLIAETTPTGSDGSAG
jgi:protein disulfide-isomerase